MNLRESTGPWRGPLPRNLCCSLGWMYVAVFLVSWWTFCDVPTTVGDEEFLDWCGFDERAYRSVWHAWSFLMAMLYPIWAGFPAEGRDQCFQPCESPTPSNPESPIADSHD